MTPSEDPSALLPLAVLGAVIGAGLAFACGYGLYHRGIGERAPAHGSHVVLNGPIAWAGWRQSAVPSGPDWYLQLRLEGDSRGFLVAASSLPTTYRARLDGPDGRPRSPLPSLVGKRAAVVVDSSLHRSPGVSTPYLSALRVEGTTIVPLTPGESSSGGAGVLLLLLGVGALGGLGLLGASVHHAVLCVRHR
jgi:hypothetical protein